MAIPSNLIDQFLRDQHRKWRERVYDRLCREHGSQVRSEYERWSHKADQKRPPRPYRDERYPENPGLAFPAAEAPKPPSPAPHRAR
ncbi:MAG TPA: hypothetical protein VMU88_00040 [bacterium]|nr:hypothetical protein [bacterium]